MLLIRSAVVRPSWRRSLSVSDRTRTVRVLGELPPISGAPPALAHAASPEAVKTAMSLRKEVVREFMSLSPFVILLLRSGCPAISRNHPEHAQPFVRARANPWPAA